MRSRPQRLATVSRRSRAILSWTCLAALAVTCAYPVMWVAFTALKDTSAYAVDPIGPPTNPSWAALTDLLQVRGFADFAVHSLLIELIVVPAVALLSAMTAFALAHMNFRVRRPTLAFVVLLMIQPPALIVLPLFFLMLELHLLNSYLGLALAYIGILSPFSVFMLYSYFLRIPKELFEAAEIDGASPLRLFRSIALPLGRSAFVALGTLLFIAVWNEPLLSVVLMQTEGTRTVAAGLSGLPGQIRVDVQVVAAGMFISLVPPIVVFALLQRTLVRSLLAGGVK